MPTSTNCSRRPPSKFSHTNQIFRAKVDPKCKVKTAAEIERENAATAVLAKLFLHEDRLQAPEEVPRNMRKQDTVAKNLVKVVEKRNKPIRDETPNSARRDLQKDAVKLNANTFQACEIKPEMGVSFTEFEATAGQQAREEESMSYKIKN